MPDIFGRNAQDYAHILALSDADQRSQVDAMSRVAGGRDIFDALPRAGQQIMQPLADVETNAQALGFLTNNLQAIQAMVEEILYLDFRINDWIPMVTDVPEGAVTYAYRVVDRQGQGSFISNMGTDANSAEANVRLQPYGLEYGGILPEWNYEDLRRAMFGGISLDRETIQAGTEGCMDHIEQIGLLGDSSVNFQGLTNHSDISIANASGTLASMTAAQVLTFLQSQTTAAITRTNEIFGRVLKRGFTFYVPINQYALITETPLGDNSDKSIWDFYKTNNTWYNYTGEMPMIKAVAEMDQAGAGSSDRMLVGFNESRVMEMAMPFGPRVINTIQKPFGVCTPMEYKISGLNVKRPGAMQYVDGI